MLVLLAENRKIKGRKVKNLRQKGLIPAVLYGPKIKDRLLSIDLKEFTDIYQKAGGTSMIKLKIKKIEANEEHQVLIKDVSIHPVTDEVIHVDFYQPILMEKVEAIVPLVFTGIAPVVRGAGGVLIKSISEIKVSALPQNLPSEIKVDVERLKTFSDNIFVKDLEIPDKVEVLLGPDDIIVSVAAPKTAEKVIGEMEEEPGELAIKEEGIESEERSKIGRKEKKDKGQRAIEI